MRSRTWPTWSLSEQVTTSSRASFQARGASAPGPSVGSPRASQSSLLGA
jgi:hypothetical protein